VLHPVCDASDAALHLLCLPLGRGTTEQTLWDTRREIMRFTRRHAKVRRRSVITTGTCRLRSVARLDATKTSLIKALSSNETATNWGVSTSSPEVIVYRRKILQALQQGDQVRDAVTARGVGAHTALGRLS